MLANLQRTITFLLATLSLGWMLYFRTQPLLAAAGFVSIVFGYVAFLGLEFLLLSSANKSDPAPHATLREMLDAWLSEVLVAPLVFCWRQPFRADAVPDRLSSNAPNQGGRGVVFIHGFFCNRGFWTPWLERLQVQGNAFVAINLEPVFGSIDDYAPQVDLAVKKITEATGFAPLIVCHSMGGLAARAWLKIYGAEARVHHIVTIGTPHSGTWLARFSSGKNGLQMRLRSDWQAQLNEGMPEGRHALFTCWYSNADNIVFPVSNATLPGADNRLVHGAAHVQMAFLPQIIEATLAIVNVKSWRNAASPLE